MKISMIMAACNQGPWLAKTIDSALIGLQGCSDYEIIIIDDHSTDDCISITKDRHPEGGRIFYHKPAGKMGVSHARHWAGEMATGDVIISTDTHCSYPRRSLWRLAHWATRTRAIIMPAIDMQQQDGSYATINGGRMMLSRRGLRIDRPRRQPKHPCMFGSIYLFSRKLWEFLGGWIRLPGYWAGEEQMVSLVAYRFGVPIVLVPKHVCQHHRYREHAQYPFDLPAHHPGEIAHYIHATCLPETYDSVWKPLLDSYYGFSMQSDPAPLRDWIDSRSVYSEKRVLKTLLGLDDLRRHPTVAQITGADGNE